MPLAEVPRERRAPEGALTGALPTPRTTGREAPAALSVRMRMVVFATVGLGLFMSQLDMTIITPALPAIHRSLHATVNWTSWSITVFTLGMLVTQPVAGRISDQFGRKRVFLICAGLFTLASLGCFLATNIYELIALRALQSIGGGGFMPSATGIVSDHFGKNRDRAIAMFTSILPLGGITGPVLGGVFVAYWSWRIIFLVNVPLGALVLVAAWRFVPYSGPRPGARTDVGGALLLTATALLAMFGVTSLGDAHMTLWSWRVLGPVAASLACGWRFARHLGRTAEPIIPLNLFRQRPFFVMNFLNTLYGATVLGIGALAPLYAEDRYHLSALDAGTVLTSRAVGTVFVAVGTSYLLRRMGYRLPMAIGFLVIAVGSTMMFLAPRGLSTYAWLAISTTITGVGMGAAMPATNNATLALSTENVAVITGMRGMFRSTGSLLSVEIMTAVLNRAAHPGLALAWGFLIVGLVLAAVIPLIYTVPDHRGSW